MAERALLTILQPSYDVEFDLQNPNPALIRKNLEADLGERFNIEISQVEYIFDGPFLKSTQTDEPFIETIKRGIQNRQNYAGSHDRRRELAEFENFNKVQTYFWEDDNPDTCVITIAARGSKGSCYQHNFFDVYEQTTDGKIPMTRYASQMSIDQFKNAAKQIGPDFDSEPQVDDVYFLRNPIKTKLSKNQLLDIFHPDHDALKVKDNRALVSACQLLIEGYIKDPSERRRRILLNFADDFIFKPQTRKELTLKMQNPDFLPMLSAQLAARPVRYVLTGCGAQGDQISIFNSAPFSVAEFGIANTSLEDQYGTLEIHCEECGVTYLRDRGKLEKNCRRCGGTRGITC